MSMTIACLPSISFDVGRQSGSSLLSMVIKRIQWCLLSIIILLVLFAASSECLLIGTTNNLAFITTSSTRSHRRSNSVSLLHASSSNELSDYYLTPGKPSSYFIVEKYDVPSNGFSASSLAELFEEADIKRLNMTTGNVTLPSALVVLDSDRYPDMKSSLRAARGGSILIQRQYQEVKQRGRSGDRVYPNDTLYRQEQLDVGASEYWHRRYASTREDGEDKPPLLPDVIFDDTHMAIVNKPGGMNLFEHGNDSKSSSMKDLLPYVVKPPADGTRDVLALPEPAHRLDKLTSGLLLVAKTRPALTHLSAQFRDRTVEKTYTAICYNVPRIILNNNLNHKSDWQCIDHPLDGKPAITYWRVSGEFEHKGIQLSLLELKPKTGRYRQLRRHMAKVKGCPLVGDPVFAKGIESKEGGGVPISLGLFLCSSSVQFYHPYYKALDLKMNGEGLQDSTEVGHNVTFVSEGSALVVNACIELPQKFAALIE